MQDESASNKRIAKNTILLYLRMVFMMFVGLFTTRVILKALGVSDLGLINVAGSVVGMFTFMNGTLTSGTQRFLTYGIGEGNQTNLNRIFSSALTLHLIFAIIIVLLCETIGLWYMLNKFVCEPERFNAAMWCYQLSVLSTFIGILLIPFNSCLIAHEHMGMYAYMSIYDASAKLLAAYLIMIIPWDRVIFYSTLCFIVNLTPTYIYNWYCRKHFEECKFKFSYDKSTMKEMLTFSGWNAIGCLADMGQGTGVNLVLNAFFGTIVNGARGIALQANNWVYKFVDSFIVAIRPQITKAYAAGDHKRLANLVCNGSSYAAYLYLFLGIPLFIEIEWILQLWLGECPEHTGTFLRIIMIQLLFQTMGHLTITAMHATGRMKAVNLTVGLALLTIVPIAYLLSASGFTPEKVLAFCVIPWIIVPFIRIYWVNKYSNKKFPVYRYVTQVYIKTAILALLMFIPPLLVYNNTTSINATIQFFLVATSSCITSCITIYYLGLSPNVRKMVVAKIKHITKR